jgi:hypothetical protein
MTFLRAARTLFAGVLLLAASAAPAAARTPVDPTTLNPAPPDFFNAECWETGAQIICTLAFSDPEIVDEPSGIVCDGVELLFSQSRSVVGKRFYDLGGNLTQRHFREFMNGTFTSPVSDGVVNWIQHDTIIHNLAVPGDLDTGNTQQSGLFARAWVPGGGSILMDVGTFLFSPTGEALRSGGKHPFDEYFAAGDAAAMDPLCEALAPA